MNHDIHWRNFLTGFIQRARTIRRIQVGHHLTQHQRLPARWQSSAFGKLGNGAFGNVRQDDPGAGDQQLTDNGAAKTAPCTGDRYNFSSKTREGI
ncbi:MAG TPA: hypothetical protein DF427_01110 [Moraxellaceae bacterium]|nr:hypothetical protein [Moraxellaceae bacterium]